MKIFSQQDPAWKDKQLGVGDCTIGQAGCFLTCFAILLELPPDVVNERVKIFGGFAGSLLSAGVVPNAYKQITVNQIWKPIPFETIDNSLVNGKAVIAQIDTSPADGVQSHFVILTSKIGNDYNMIDPWPLVDNLPATLLGRYGKGRSTKDLIQYIAIVGGVDMSSVQENAAPVTTEQPTIPVLGDSIITLFGDSRLRTAPGLNAPIICKLPKGIEITRNPEIEVIKDDYRWIHLDLWMAAESIDGKNKFVK